MAKSHSLAQFRQAVAGLRERYSVYQEGEQQWEEPEELAVFNLKFPPWICQVLNFKIITRYSTESPDCAALRPAAARGLPGEDEEDRGRGEAGAGGTEGAAAAGDAETVLLKCTMTT